MNMPRGMADAIVRIRERRPGARSAWERGIAWFNGLELDESAILVVFGVAVGTTTALSVILFFKLIGFAHNVLFTWPVSLIHGLDFPIYRPIVTAIGIAVAAWISRRYAGGEDGPNVPFVQHAVTRRGGRIPSKPTLAHAAASAVTIGGGGSAGTEGPVAVVGATVGSFLGRAFRFSSERVVVLVAAGAASGISASFNAPIAGAFFALEEILGSLVINAFPAVVVASVVAAVIARAFNGNHPAFPLAHQYSYTWLRELLIFFPTLGVLGGFVGVLFVRLDRWMAQLMPRIGVRPALIPWFVGATVGIIVLASDGMLAGYGYDALRSTVFGRLTFTTLTLLCVGKILATTLTLRGGGSGGVFAPSLYVGAVMGGAFGVGLARLFPGIPIQPEAYALVGMGVMIAAATHAPITAILIVFEMTNDYAITMPLMLAVVVGFTVARSLEGDSLYTRWHKRRGAKSRPEAESNVLKQLHVRDVLHPPRTVLRDSASVAEMLAGLGQSDENEFPVVTEDQLFVGTIRVADIGQIALEHRDLSSLLVAADVALPTETAKVSDTLYDAMRRMGVRGTTMLPVIDSSNRLIGIVTRAQILTRYERALLQDDGARSSASSQ